LAKLTYGLLDGNLVHIDDVRQGLECRCLCPNCKTKLIAKHGSINEHHFAHESKDCDIITAQETALHIMAKEILSESKFIKLPKVILKDKFAFIGKEEFTRTNPYVVEKCYLNFKLEKYKDNQQIIDNIIVEPYLGNIKPDILLEIGDKKLLVEIAVTHFIDNKKLNKIIELGIPTIEINLSSYKNNIDRINKEELSKFLLKNNDCKKWIYYKNYLQDIEEIADKNRNTIKKLYWMKNYFEKNFSRQYKSCYLRNNYDTEEFLKFWEWYALSKKIGTPPWFINMPIDGDILFIGDRRMWQTAVFYDAYRYKNIDFNRVVDKLGKLHLTRENYPCNLWIEQERDPNSPLTEYKMGKSTALTNKTILDTIRDYYKFLKEQNIIA
jgi:hypothetical protein